MSKKIDEIPEINEESYAFLIEDKEKKRELVKKAIVSYCNEQSDHKELRDIGKALKNNGGNDLVVEILTGGMTNYSYKVSLKRDDDDDSNNTCDPLFAKLSFSYALWNPDRSTHFDVIRTENEAKMMKLFDTIAPGCVAKPLLCVDVGDDGDMKLLVTEWCKSDEQWANQFIDGDVDVRFAKTFAQGLARFNCVDIEDKNFNDNIRPSYNQMMPLLILKLNEMIESTDESDRAAVYVKTKLGKELANEMANKAIKNFTDDREVLIHNDMHQFNILVEKKPTSTSTLFDETSFGEDGTFAICDWEMVMVGPKGKDIGQFHGYPILCSLAHAINGNEDSCKKVLDYLDLIWNIYADTIQKERKEKGMDHSDEYMKDLARDCIGIIGQWIFLAYYSVRAHIEFLPTDVNTSIFNHPMGIIAVKFMEIGYLDTIVDFSSTNNNTPSVDELRMIYRNIIEEEIHIIHNSRIGLPKAVSNNRRRSSILRASGRRISDTDINLSIPDIEEITMSNVPTTATTTKTARTTTTEIIRKSFTKQKRCSSLLLGIDFVPDETIYEGNNNSNNSNKENESSSLAQ